MDGLIPEPRHGAIAVLTDRFPVLSETFVVNEIAELARLGYRVHVEANARPRGPRVPAHPVRYFDEDTLRSKPTALVDLIARHPLRVNRDRRGQRRWREQETVRRLRALGPRVRRLRRIGVEHIHAHFASGAALDAMRAAQLLGVPFSFTAHAYDIFETPTNLREKLESAAFVTTGCEYNRRYLQGLAPSVRDRIHVIVMGVDTEKFARRTPHAGGRHVIAVGRLVEKKGFSDLIEAVRQLEADAPVNKLTIVGDGPLRPHLTRQIEEAGVGHRVELAGSRTPEEIRELLEQADALAMPAVVAANGDRDSMPVVVKEALAMEVPVVATDEVGLPELVRPEFGVLVEPRDPRDLASGISNLLARPPEERIAMGRAGRAHVIEHCNVRTETAKLAALIG